MGDTESGGDEVDEAAPDRVNIDYIKGNLFRTISPTGLIGSVTPEGRVQFGLFSERQAIPRRVVYRLEDDGRLGDRIETVGRDAVVRELEAVVSLDRETARDLLRFLSEFMRGTEEDTPKGDGS